MTSTTLARSYLDKARARLEMIEFLRARQAHSDVVPEAQELVELATDTAIERARFVLETATMVLAES